MSRLSASQDAYIPRPHGPTLGVYLRAPFRSLGTPKRRALLTPVGLVPVGPASSSHAHPGQARPATNGAGSAWLLMTTAGYAEKVRSRFLSLHQVTSRKIHSTTSSA